MSRHIYANDLNINNVQQCWAKQGAAQKQEPTSQRTLAQHLAVVANRQFL